MKEETKIALADYLKSHEIVALRIAREANQYNDCFDWTDYFDLEDLCSVTDAYEIARSIIYGDVRNIMDPVRYDAYGNLCSITEHELEKEVMDYIDEIVDAIEEHGDDLNLTNEIKEILKEDK